MSTQPENGQRTDSAEERRARITEIVQERGSIRIADLVEPLGVSEPTLRKDLTVLEKEGVLKRTHGGATAVGAARNMHDAQPPAPQAAPRAVSAGVPTAASSIGAGERIARYCLDMIADDSSAFFDSGSTMVTMAELMERSANVLTNSIPVVPILADKPRIRHTLLGGQYRTLGECLTGPIAMMGLQQFTVDIAFMGVIGITAEGGYVTDVSEADIKRAAIDSARRVVVPLDSSKVGTVGFCHLVTLDRIDDIVTDEPNVELRKWCEVNNVRLHIAR